MFGFDLGPFFKYPGLGGVHRGEYVEDPDWSEPGPRWRKGGLTYLKDGSIIWNGTVTIANKFQPDPAVVTFATQGGPGTLPALIGGEPPGVIPDWNVMETLFADQQAANEEARRQEIRAIVQDEMNATPIYTGLQFKEW